MIDILLSTYNGERFLAEQIGSILGQTYADFRLLVRDDGSSDETLSIIEKFAGADSRVSPVAEKRENLGAAASFMALVGRSEAAYFMLADQDDVWLENKIEQTLARITQMEDEHGTRTPLAVFTDLHVVDADLNLIDDSFWHFQSLDPAISRDWKKLLSQNVVTGCTLMANAAVRRCVLPFALPEMLHDHWIAVNVAKNGKIGYLDAATVLYRQHAENIEGARRVGPRYLAKRSTGIGERISFYRRASAYFGDVTPLELMSAKLLLNVRRLKS